MINTGIIPPNFVPEFYRTQIKDLKDGDSLWRHFSQTGMRNGLMGSPACEQGYFVRLIQHMQPNSILEIGPGCAPKIRGDNVFYFDVKSEEELAQRYRNTENQSIPEKIHYVEKTGDLKVIDRKFDVIFSAHVVEHVDDFITHLNEISNLLTDRGLYFMVVPNKKYTFDYYKPATTIEDVIAAHFDNDRSDSVFLRSVMLEKLRRTHNDAKRHWMGDHGSMNENGNTIDHVIRELEQKKNDSVYRSGFHRWYFDEVSFPRIVDDLHASGLCALKVQACYNTPMNNLSFNAIIGR